MTANSCLVSGSFLTNNSIGKYGLIYVRASDPISWLAHDFLDSNIHTDVDYVYLGFYYTSGLTGDIDYQIVIKSIFTASSPPWFENISLIDLINNPIAERIQIKPILCNERNDDIIRTLIIKFLEIQETSYDLLFSALLGDAVPITSLMILIPHINNIIVSIEKNLGVISRLKRNPSILYDSDVFDKIKIISLPTHEAEFILETRNNYYKQLEPILQKFSNFVVNSIFKDNSIITAIRKRNHGTLSDKHFSHLSGILKVTNDSIINRHLSISSLQQALKSLQECLDNNNIPIITNNSQLATAEKDSSILFVDTSEGADYEEYIDAINSLQREILTFSRAVKKKKLSSDDYFEVVDINVLINAINKLTKLSGIGSKIHPHRGSYSTTISAVVREKRDDNVAFRGSNNNLLQIHTRHFDLSTYMPQQLLEILVAIDNQTSSDDTSFDKLRAAIITRLYTLL